MELKGNYQYVILEADDLETFVITSHFNYVDFMIRYCIINMCSSIGVIAFWYLIGQAIFRWTQNKINALLKRPTEYKFSDVWSNVFEDDLKKKLKNRMFQQALYEYYDVQNDLPIKFYDTKNYDKKYALEE